MASKNAIHALESRSHPMVPRRKACLGNNSSSKAWFAAAPKETEKISHQLSRQQNCVLQDSEWRKEGPSCPKRTHCVLLKPLDLNMAISFMRYSLIGWDP